MQQNVARLTIRQTRAIEALLTEPSQEKAAKKAKVSRATLARWLSEPAFQQAYQEARAKLLETVLTALNAASIRAVKTLMSVMGDTEAQPAARVSAARAVLDNLLRIHETVEIEQRLAALEQVGEK